MTEQELKSRSFQFGHEALQELAGVFARKGVGLPGKVLEEAHALFRSMYEHGYEARRQEIGGALGSAGIADICRRADEYLHGVKQLTTFVCDGVEYVNFGRVCEAVRTAFRDGVLAAGESGLDSPKGMNMTLSQEYVLRKDHADLTRKVGEVREENDLLKQENSRLKDRLNAIGTASKPFTFIPSYVDTPAFSPLYGAAKELDMLKKENAGLKKMIDEIVASLDKLRDSDFTFTMPPVEFAERLVELTLCKIGGLKGRVDELRGGIDGLWGKNKGLIRDHDRVFATAVNTLPGLSVHGSETDYVVAAIRQLAAMNATLSQHLKEARDQRRDECSESNGHRKVEDRTRILDDVMGILGCTGCLYTSAPAMARARIEKLQQEAVAPVLQEVRNAVIPFSTPDEEKVLNNEPLTLLKLVLDRMKAKAKAERLQKAKK